MTSRIDSESLKNWCKVPVDQLESHPEAKVKIKILSKPDEVHYYTARMMADEVKDNNTKGLSTRWILPCGPTGQYKYFAKIINEEKISLKDLYVFHMDDCLDWQGRPLPLDHQFSYQGQMLKIFYAPIDEALSVPESQRYFPSIYDLDNISKGIEKVGGVDTMFGGSATEGISHIMSLRAHRGSL